MILDSTRQRRLWSCETANAGDAKLLVKDANCRFCIAVCPEKLWPSRGDEMIYAESNIVPVVKRILTEPSIRKSTKNSGFLSKTVLTKSAKET